MRGLALQTQPTPGPQSLLFQCPLRGKGRVGDPSLPVPHSPGCCDGPWSPAACGQRGLWWTPPGCACILWGQRWGWSSHPATHVQGCLLRAPKLPHPRVRATLLVAESTMVQSLAALLCTNHALLRYSWLGQKTKTQGVEGPRSFYQPKDVTGQENRIIKPQVHRPSKGVALILSSLLTPRSCLTTHTAKGIPSVTAQFEKLARWPFQELLR